ncbi:MAG: DUF429 domain-containing protein [Oceanidesulfovibrio sp.]
MLLIGVDCAANPRNVGVALGTLNNNHVHVSGVFSGRNRHEIVERIADAIREAHGPVLLCLDAPLGWPRALGDELHTHIAGASLEASADRLFSRETDRFVRQALGKRPLEVGANFIARTARATLDLLESLREATGQAIPLGWQPLSDSDGAAALETYPAAVLSCRGLAMPCYKKDHAKREHVLASLAEELHVSDDIHTRTLATEHALDAALCLLAGADFQRGLALAPPKPLREAAMKEGWIWVRGKK